MGSIVSTNDLPGEVEGNYGGTLVTGPSWMRDFLEEYRKVITENYKAKQKSLHEFLTEEALQDAHNAGVEQVMNLFTEYKKSLKDSQQIDGNVEEKLRICLAKEFGRLRDDNFNKLCNYLESVLDDILEQGKESLKKKFTFDPNPNVEYLNADKITSSTEEVIKERVDKFQEKISTQEFGEQITRHRETCQGNLKQKLEKIGNDEGAKYLHELNLHLKSTMEKCIKAYKTDMEMTTVGKSLKEMKEIENMHFSLVEKSLGKLVKEIGRNAEDHFRQLSFDILKVFENLIHEKEEETKGRCLTAIRNVFSRCQIPYEEESEAEMKILVGIEETIKGAIKHTLEVASKSAGEIDVTITRIDLDSSDDLDDYDNGSEDSETDHESSSETSSMDVFNSTVTVNGKNISEKRHKLEDTIIENNNENVNLTVASTSTLTVSVNSADTTLVNSTTTGENETTVINNFDSTVITQPLENQEETNSDLNDKAATPARSPSPRKLSGKENSLPSSKCSASPRLKIGIAIRQNTVSPDLLASSQTSSTSSDTIPEVGLCSTSSSDVGSSATDISTCSNSIPNQNEHPSSSKSSQEEASRSKWRSIEVPNSTHLITHPPTTPISKGKGPKRKSMQALQKSANFFEALRSFGIRFTSKGIIAGVSINHVPNILVQECCNEQVSVTSVDSLTIPALVGLMKNDNFVIGKEATLLEFHERKQIWDLFHPFQNPNDFDRKNSTHIKINGEKVKFHVELLLGIFLYEVKLKMEKILEEKFGRAEVKLEKVVISLPPHFLLFQIQQVRDASLIAGFKDKYVVLINDASSLALDFSRRQFSCAGGNNEMGRNQGNILIISQYFDGSMNIICFSSYNYKTELEKFTKLSIHQLGYQNLPKFAQFVPRIEMSTSSNNLDHFNDIWMKGKHFVKNLPNDYPDLPVFCQLNCEDPDWLDRFKDEIENMLSEDGTIAVHLLPCDGFAFNRGVVSVGSYGYWWNRNQAKKPDHFEVEMKDCFISYSSNPDFDFDPRSLTNEECNHCNLDLIRIFGGSTAGKNQQGKASSKKVCERAGEAERKSSRKRFLSEKVMGELGLDLAPVGKKSKSTNETTVPFENYMSHYVKFN